MFGLLFLIPFESSQLTINFLKWGNVLFYFVCGTSQVCQKSITNICHICIVTAQWRDEDRLFQEWIYQRKQVILAMAFFTKQFLLGEREDLHHRVAAPHRIRKHSSIYTEPHSVYTPSAPCFKS